MYNRLWNRWSFTQHYSGFFGRQLAQHKTASSATAATAVRSSAAAAVSSSVSETVTKQTEVRSKVRA